MEELSLRGLTSSVTARAYREKPGGRAGENLTPQPLMASLEPYLSVPTPTGPRP